MPKIVVTDYTFPNLEIEQQVLQPSGCELAGHQCRTLEALTKVVRDADYVLPPSPTWPNARSVCEKPGKIGLASG